MSLSKAFVKGTPVGIQLPTDGGFTVYIDEFGNAVCGTPPWVKAQVTKDPIATTEPVPNQDIIGHGFVSHMPTPITPLPDHPQPYTPTDPVFPVSDQEPAELYPGDGDTTKEAFVCFIPPGTVHEYLPGDNPEPTSQPLYDDGGFTVYIDENGNAVCGTPPTGYGQPVEPLPPLTIDSEGTISHNPIGGPVQAQPIEQLPPLTIDSEGTISHNPITPVAPTPIYAGVIDMGDDDVQTAINNFIHSGTVKQTPVKDIENIAQPVPVAPDSHHDNGIMPVEHGPQAPEVFM